MVHLEVERLRPITVSIVVYGNGLADIYELLQCLQNDENILCWVVVDNGSSYEMRDAVRQSGGTYIRPGRNLGFGAGHNLALKHLAAFRAPYHLILNPDIALDEKPLGMLIEIMDSNPDVGLLMPKVIYPDGSNQHLCKLLPAPIDLVLRRFMPRSLKCLAQRRISSYELRGLNYDAPAYVPSLSGCFMLVRRSVLDVVGGFDERFFLYMEDVDLCRRILAVSRLLYWPGVTVKHVHQMGSYRSKKLLLLHVRSAIRYFNKWGWFFDEKRAYANHEILASFQNK